VSDPVSDLRGAVSEAAADLRGDGALDGAKLDRPPRPDFGDYSTNAAMLLAPSM
jgi:arginyl-tRNA synthetase